jgi:hypothetical protein
MNPICASVRRSRAYGPEREPEWSGEILKCEPPRVLSYTFAEGSEAPSRVTFEIGKLGESAGPDGEPVRLTITHDEFPVGSEVMEKVSNGWPGIGWSQDASRNRPPARHHLGDARDETGSRLRQPASRPPKKKLCRTLTSAQFIEQQQRENESNEGIKGWCPEHAGSFVVSLKLD